MSSYGVPADAKLLDDRGQMAQAWRELLRNLARDTNQVGDYIESARTDLGAGWLLCDGSSVKQIDYPALYALMAAASHAFGGSGPGTFSLPVIAPVYDSRDPAPGGTPVLQTWIKAL